MINTLIFLLLVLSCALGAWLFSRLGNQALTAYAALQCVMANLFVTKQIMLFGLLVTASDAYAVGTTVTLNLLHEYEGIRATRSAIWITFCATAFYTLCTLLHLAFAPAAADITQSAFMLLLYPMPRLCGASLVTYLIVQHLDTWIYARLKQYTAHHLPAGVRSGISAAISQFFDTILFSFLGLYGTIGSITDVIVFSYAIKLCTVFLVTPMVHLLVRAHRC
jgi:hypothetical protein